MHVRRMQQILSKKNSYTIDINQRSQLTGQVVNDSKIARLSDNETSALLVMGAENILNELLGGRSDNKEKKQRMYEDIARYGYANISSNDPLVNDQVNSNSNVVLNTIDVMFLGAGLKTDLINDTYIIDEKKIKK